MTNDDGKQNTNNPLNEDDKKNLQNDVSNTTNAIAKKVLDGLKETKQEVKEEPVKQETFDKAVIEAQIREKLIAEMNAKMEAEKRAQEETALKQSMQSMADEIQALKGQLQASNSQKNYEGQEVQMANPFNSEGKKFDELTKTDLEALDRASKIAFERERLK